MVINFLNDLGVSGFNASMLIPLKTGALAYLGVSILGPLSWIAAVEICRRARTRQGDAAQGNSSVHGMALSVARSKDASAAGWRENHLQQG